MLRKPRWLLSTAVMTGAACGLPAPAQDIDAKTGLPTSQGVSMISNGAMAPGATQGQYGSSLQPTAAAQPESLSESLGTGAQLPKFMPRVSAAHLTGTGLGYRDGFTTVEAWVPLQVGDENQLMFADIKGIVNNRSRLGGNLGFGFRRYNSNLNRIFGLYGYFDYRDSGAVRYNQVSFGAETLGTWFDARTNVYVPVNDKLSVISDTFDCDNPRFFQSFLLLKRTKIKETALRGFDGEVGATLIPQIRLRGYVGGYFFDGQETPQAYGFRARVETQATQNVHLQLTWQTDRVFGENLWGGATISWPGAGRRSIGDGQPDLLDRLNDPVARLYNIVLNRPVEITEEAAANVATGQAINVFHVDDNGLAGGTGTVNNPFTTLGQAQAVSKPGDIILVRSGTYIANSITLQKDQLLIGEGIPLIDPCTQQVALRIPTVQCPTGIRLPNLSTNLADRPVLLNSQGNAVTLGDNNTVAGLNIVSPTGSGISGNNIISTNIQFVDVTQAGAAGISITNITGVGQFRNNNLVQNAGGGLVVTNNGATSASLDIHCNNFNNNTGDGLLLQVNDTANLNATIQENIGSGNTGFGFSAIANGGTMTLDSGHNQWNNNITGGTRLIAVNGGSINGTFFSDIFNGNNTGGAPTPASGLFIVAGDLATGGTVQADITNSQFQNNEGSGIVARMFGNASSLTLNVATSQLLNNQQNGVAVNAQAGAFVGNFVTNDITGNARNGINYQGFGPSTGNLTVTGNVITNNGANAATPAANRDGVLIQLFGTNAQALTANFTNNNISNNGNAGRGNGVNILAINTGTTTAGANLVFANNNISSNAENGVLGQFGGGGALAMALSLRGNVINANGGDGAQFLNRQFSELTALIDNNSITNNLANGIQIDNSAQAAGETPGLQTRIQGNIIDDNGFATFLTAGVRINVAGNGVTGVNNININNNQSISRNNIGIFITNGARTATSITNHRNLFNDLPRIADNASAGIVISDALTGGAVPADRTFVHDVRITNNSIRSTHEAIVLGVDGGSANPALGGSRMDAIVTQNLMNGPAFTPLMAPFLESPVFNPAPPPIFLPAAPATVYANARFFAGSFGTRSFMRLRLEQSNVNDLQYNLLNNGPVVTAPGNTDGSLFDVASTASTNQGLGGGFFGTNSGVFGFARGAAFGAFTGGQDFDPTQSNLFINVVQPNAINPGPFPPPP